LLVLAFTLGPAITKHYNRPICASCNDLASEHPKVAFEFSTCSSQYTPDITRPNLMNFRVMHPMSSPVPLFVPVAFGLVAVLLAYLAAACWTWEGEYKRGNLFFFNTFITTLWAVAGNGFFQLFMRDNCYLSAWNTQWMTYAWWVSVLVFIPLAFYALCKFVLADYVHRYVITFFWFLSILAVVAAAAMSGYLAWLTLHHTKAFMHLIFASFVALSLIDSVVYYYCYSANADPYTAIGGKNRSEFTSLA